MNLEILSLVSQDTWKIISHSIDVNIVACKWSTTNYYTYVGGTHYFQMWYYYIFAQNVIA
ncbi:unnamed protein product [Spirodela intermedia]|uniref:Uncharacterized protein n=1 Tax=Spirodela intermedia TaxID=51605 RepID=A0A7I8KAJ2_SPIIN|nr:unnamed protein product [Spirodela intermedia]